MSFSNEFNTQHYTEPSRADSAAHDQIMQKVHAIQNNTNTIKTAVLAAHQSRQSTQRIVLGMGELHGDGLHIIQQIDILKALQESGLYCATALEWPPNNINLHIDEFFKHETTDTLGLKIMLEARENRPLRNRLSADTTPIRTANAKLSRTLLHEFMDKSHIPVFCSDAPRDWDLFIRNERKVQHLLTSDHKVIEAIREARDILDLPHSNGSVAPIVSLKQLGMLVRNIYTKNATEAFLQEHPELDVILVEAGRAHITGNEALMPEPSPYDHNISSLFAHSSNHLFIGAPLYMSEEDKIQNTPVQALQNPQILTLDHLGKSPFNTHSSSISNLQETEHIQNLSPYFSFISDTLCAQSPLELLEVRSETLKTDLLDLRYKNGFIRSCPIKAQL